jgi:hypothetical protein
MNKLRGPGKWGSEGGPVRTNTGSSIRGKIISPPIPFPEDDEFPIRAHGTGIAPPLGTEGVDNSMRLRGSTAAELDNTCYQTGAAVTDFIDPTMETPVPAQQSQESPLRFLNPGALRTSMGSMPSGTSVGKPQRKKSYLRSVLGRLFGKKRKGSASPTSQDQDLNNVRAEAHRSVSCASPRLYPIAKRIQDPTALSRNPKETSGSQKRSASLPINEFNRALNSHSVVMEEFPLQNENETNRDSIQADGHTRPRRATTPSRLWEPHKAQAYADWTGLSPRPASTHARPDGEAEEAIGMAVTSGSHPNRRSRSLGELRDIAPSHTVTRRRSDEIRYWRESYDPGVLSPMSSNKAEVEEEPIMIDEEEDLPEEPQGQPQPFNFHLDEMAGMKITQAANLETRVTRLEERMLKLERIVSSINYGTSAEPVQFQDPPKRSSKRNLRASMPRPQTDDSELSLPEHQRNRETRQARPEAGTQGSQMRSSSYGSSRPSTVSTSNSYHPSFDSFPPPVFPTSDTGLSQKTARPLSTSTTIRGLSLSSPTTAKDGSLTGEHYAALVNMILAEKGARQHLEGVVHNLQQQLQAVRSSALASFPTPPTDQMTDPSTKTERGGEFSGFERDYSSDEEGRYATEDFQTPNEEAGQLGEGIFGEVPNNNLDMKSAPRTLSLSQITLGRGVQHSVNF